MSRLLGPFQALISSVLSHILVDVIECRYYFDILDTVGVVHLFVEPCAFLGIVDDVLGCVVGSGIDRAAVVLEIDHGVGLLAGVDRVGGEEHVFDGLQGHVQVGCEHRGADCESEEDTQNQTSAEQFSKHLLLP